MTVSTSYGESRTTIAKTKHLGTWYRFAPPNCENYSRNSTRRERRHPRNEGDKSWNHRVIRRKFPNGEVLYAIHEVYYGFDGKPRSCTENPIRIQEESVSDLKKTMKRIRRALKKPVLKYEDF